MLSYLLGYLIVRLLLSLPALKHTVKHASKMLERGSASN